jgi:hypothetical protein
MICRSPERLAVSRQPGTQPVLPLSAVDRGCVQQVRELLLGFGACARFRARRQASYAPSAITVTGSSTWTVTVNMVAPAVVHSTRNVNATARLPCTFRSE